MDAPLKNDRQTLEIPSNKKIKKRTTTQTIKTCKKKTFETTHDTGDSSIAE